MSFNQAINIYSLPVPENEQERIKELKTYDILDTLPEDDFDALTSLAARLCNLPVSQINFINTDEQFTKSCVGKSADIVSRSQSICQYTILTERLFEINDLTKDERFEDMPYVNGEPYFRYYAGVPLKTDNGHSLGALCVLDYKPNKLTEQQINDLQILANEIMVRLKLRKREKSLNKINDFKDRLMKVVSHDIRSPLTGIFGAAEYLQDPQIDHDEKLELTNIILESAGQIQNIVSELLDAELAEFGKLEQQTDPINLTGTIEEIISQIRYPAKNKDIKLHYSFENDIPDIMIDEYKYKRIISNLITNAIKFTPRGGDIFINCRYSKNETKSNNLITTVEDTGIGMSENQLQNLFLEKEEGGTPGTENEFSYGMGMVIVKKLCEVCNAEINVESEVDKGTIFKVEIPAEVAEMEMSDY